MPNLQKYNISNLYKVASIRGFLGVLSHFGTTVNQRYYQSKVHSGVDIMTEDWDNLFILDGCRYDLFSDRCMMDGDLSYRESPGSESSEFLEKNFAGRELHDTVYITSNPHAPKIPEDTFHAVWNLLETDWDEELRTVHPSDMRMKILQALDEFPNKRLIGHFMQPHYPFIGEYGRKVDHSGIDPDPERVHEAQSIWTRLQFGLGIEKNEVWKAYGENLDIVLSSVEQLLEEIDGKTVITADHGNLVGDRCGPVPTRGYGHPRNLYVEPLVKIPWFEPPQEERRTIESDEPRGGDRLADDNVNDRLSALGYR